TASSAAPLRIATETRMLVRVRPPDGRRIAGGSDGVPAPRRTLPGGGDDVPHAGLRPSRLPCVLAQPALELRDKPQPALGRMAAICSRIAARGDGSSAEPGRVFGGICRPTR